MEDLLARFGPRGEEEESIFAVEALLADVQLAIQTAMREQGINKSELAARLGCKPSNVTQLLSENAKLKVQTVARIFHALGMACEFRCYATSETEPAEWRSVGSISTRRRDDVILTYLPARPTTAHNSNRRPAIAA